MAPPLFDAPAPPPPLYSSHPGVPLYNAPLPQFPPPSHQPLFNQPISATPFVTAHIDSTSNRGSIIDFFNSAGGFKPTTEIAPIPPELIHNKFAFSLLDPTDRPIELCSFQIDLLGWNSSWLRQSEKRKSIAFSQ